ncbi:MAG: CHC2 zinc finger domain-containing protein, partial [Bacteroidota bacterium]
MIAEESVREVIETARIEDVVADFVSLRRRGQNYIGLCPF